MLTRSEIERQIDLGNIKIFNRTSDSLNKPNSCDVRLGSTIYSFKDNQVLDSKKGPLYINEVLSNQPNELYKENIPEYGYILMPNKLYLAKTVEKVETHGYIPAFFGKANLSQLGISVDLNSGYKTADFDGYLLLSIIVSKPTIIYPNIKIGNLAFFKSLDSSLDEKLIDNEIKCGLYNSGMLSGLEIERRMQFEKPDIVINPSDNILINPNSVNLTLNENIGVYANEYIDLKKENPIKRIVIGDEGYLFKKNELYLARTNEWTETNNLIPMISGRSSLGRNGIHVHSSACMGSIGYKGYWHIGARPVCDIIVKKNMQFCQLYYLTPEGEITTTYNGSMNNLPSEEIGSQLYKKLKK